MEISIPLVAGALPNFGPEAAVPIPEMKAEDNPFAVLLAMMMGRAAGVAANQPLAELLQSAPTGKGPSPQDALVKLVAHDVAKAPIAGNPLLALLEGIPEKNVQEMFKTILDALPKQAGKEQVKDIVFMLELSKEAMPDVPTPKSGETKIVVPVDHEQLHALPAEEKIRRTPVQEGEKFSLVREFKKDFALISEASLAKDILEEAHEAVPDSGLKAAEIRSPDKTAAPYESKAAEEAKLTQAVLRQIVEKVFKPPMKIPSMVTMRLNPPELGEIVVRIALDNKNLKVHMVTGSPAVKEMLEGGLSELRSAVQSLGMKAESVFVSMRQDTSGRNMYHQQGESRRARFATGFLDDDEILIDPARPPTSRALAGINYFA